MIRPILETPDSVNQRLLSGPAVIHEGWLLDVTGNSVILPAGNVLFMGVELLVLVEFEPVGFVLPPVVPPQADRSSMRRSPGMAIRTNLRANWEEMRIKVMPFAETNVVMLVEPIGTLLAAAKAATAAWAGTVPASAAKAADWAAANLVDKGMKAAARTLTRSALAAYTETRPAPVQRRLAVPLSRHRFRRRSRSASQ